MRRCPHCGSLQTQPTPPLIGLVNERFCSSCKNVYIDDEEGE